MLGTLKAGFWGLLVAGCTTKTGPSAHRLAEKTHSPAPANVQKVTLYVEGMIERQNIT
jgi:hypothetical protein